MAAQNATKQITDKTKMTFELEEGLVTVLRHVALLDFGTSSSSEALRKMIVAHGRVHKNLHQYIPDHYLDPEDTNS